MKTNLIIVEGLPGSGKSTTAAMIADELRKKGKTVMCLDEGASEHPADYADYDFPDFETERLKILDKWRSFVEKADPNTIYVFNCLFLQNPLSETMMRFGLEEEISQTYIGEIASVIQPLNPVIVYIDQPDVRGSVDRVLDERGSDWLKAVIDYHTGQGYGKEHNLAGYDGYIKCLEERKARELRILQALDADCYTISQDMTAAEFQDLFDSAGWSSPDPEQLSLALQNSTKSFVVRHNGQAAATINWLGDRGMPWFMKEFIVHKDYQGQMLGTFLYRFSENYIKSTLKPGWRVCLDLRSAKGSEAFYQKLGFAIMEQKDSGSGMEKMIGENEKEN